MKTLVEERETRRHATPTFDAVVPRCLPFETDLSDGLELGGSLEFLVDAVDSENLNALRRERRRIQNSNSEAISTFTVCEMIALSKKRFPGAGGGFLLHARATSGWVFSFCLSIYLFRPFFFHPPCTL